MNTVTLELLRHGESSNQLLSPLTRYLALCGNQDPEELRAPYRHAELLQLLQALREHTCTRVQSDTARLTRGLAEMLRPIRSLTGALARGSDLVELRLVLSAAELALLPFELLAAPLGHTQEGRLTHWPIEILRTTRRVPESTVQWPSRPRILVAAAAPGAFPAVPLVSHLVALRRALRPWQTTDSSAEFARGLGDRDRSAYVTVLPAASVVQIQRAFAEQAFTHVHLLAHGAPLGDRREHRFGVALHGGAGGTDVVSGAQIASAFPYGRRPAVVTAAVCDSGNVGSVTLAGGSVAHALHEAGVPLVIASQLPLSYEGSRVMVKHLYEGLLWGEDPRLVLHRTRCALFAQLGHQTRPLDWASLVAYGALPADFEVQCGRARVHMARRASDAAIATVGGDQHFLPAAPSSATGRGLDLDDTRRRLDDAHARLLANADDDAIARARHHKYIASAELRWAEHALLREEKESKWRVPLQRARDHFRKALDQSPAHQSWLAHYLAVEYFLTGAVPEVEHEFAERLVLLRRRRGSLSQREIRSEILVGLLGPVLEPSIEQQLLRTLDERLDAMLDMGRDQFAVYSLYRQLGRCCHQAWSRRDDIRARANQLRERLKEHGGATRWSRLVLWIRDGDGDQTLRDG